MVQVADALVPAGDVHLPGTYRVGADVMFSVVDSDLTGESDHAGSRSSVGCEVWPAPPSVNRSDVDNQPTAPLDHMWDSASTGAVDARQVHIENPLPARRIGVHDPGDDPDSRAVDENVDAAILRIALTSSR